VREPASVCLVFRNERTPVREADGRYPNRRPFVWFSATSERRFVGWADRVLRYDARAVRREGAALARGRFDAVVAKVRQLTGWR
jgi:hypothetical protein